MAAKKKPDYLVNVGIQNDGGKTRYTDVGAAWVNPGSDSVTVALKFGVLEKTLWCFLNENNEDAQVVAPLSEDADLPDFVVFVPVKSASSSRSSFTRIGNAKIDGSGAIKLNLDIATSAESLVLFRPKTE